MNLSHPIWNFCWIIYPHIPSIWSWLSKCHFFVARIHNKHRNRIFNSTHLSGTPKTHKGIQFDQKELYVYVCVCFFRPFQCLPAPIEFNSQNSTNALKNCFIDEQTIKTIKTTCREFGNSILTLTHFSGNPKTHKGIQFEKGFNSNNRNSLSLSLSLSLFDFGSFQCLSTTIEFNSQTIICKQHKCLEEWF